MKVIRKVEAGAVDLRRLLNDLKNSRGKVGWFESEKYPDGTPVAYVAAIQEFGSPEQKIPARPTLRPTIIEREKEWGDIAEQGAKAIIKGSINANDMMELLVLKAAGDVKETITKLQSPPLADATVAARVRKRANKKLVGSLTKPLVDTGRMLNTLIGIVVGKKK